MSTENICPIRVNKLCLLLPFWKERTSCNTTYFVNPGFARSTQFLQISHKRFQLVLLQARRSAAAAQLSLLKTQRAAPASPQKFLSNQVSYTCTCCSARLLVNLSLNQLKPLFRIVLLHLLTNSRVDRNSFPSHQSLTRYCS